MWPVSALGIALIFFLPSEARWWALPIAAMWTIAPLVAHSISRPIRVKQEEITPSQRHWLRQLGRTTWLFFEESVTSEHHWLPPDNVQEYPQLRIAPRVSPTNEGLYVVAALAARDLGYLSLHNVVELWERNLKTFESLERLHGHFYNWYSTVSLTPLLPRYISTVDSGNLAVALVTLQQGIEDLRKAPVFRLNVHRW